MGTESTETGARHDLTRRYETAGPETLAGRYSGFTLRATGASDALHATDFRYDAAGRLDRVIAPAGTFTNGYLANASLIEIMSSPTHIARNTHPTGPFCPPLRQRRNWRSRGSRIQARFVTGQTMTPAMGK